MAEDRYYIAKRGDWCIIKGTITKQYKKRIYANPYLDNFKNYKVVDCCDIRISEGYYATDNLFFRRNRDEREVSLLNIAEIPEATYKVLKDCATKVIKQIELFEASCKTLLDNKNTKK
jgi:hypothetical protein